MQTEASALQGLSCAEFLGTQHQDRCPRASALPSNAKCSFQGPLPWCIASIRYFHLTHQISTCFQGDGKPGIVISSWKQQDFKELTK